MALLLTNWGKVSEKKCVSTLIFEQKCMVAGHSTHESCLLKREIINIALEGGCELITAVGTHQHPRSTVLCSYTFPKVEMSSFTVITFLPPLTIDYLHFSIWSSAVEMARTPQFLYFTDQAEQKCPARGFLCRKWAEAVSFREGRGQNRTTGKAELCPTCPLAACMSELLQVE